MIIRQNLVIGFQTRDVVDVAHVGALRITGAPSGAAVEKVPDSAGTMAVSLAVVPEMAPAVAAAGAQGYLSVMRELP